MSTRVASARTMRATHDDVLSIELPYRDRLRVRRTVFDGGRGGPTVAVVAGVHGDEIEGLYVCHRLARFLGQLEHECPEAIRGRVELYPALNPLGLDCIERTVPTYDVDLNRSFPGHRAGLLPQRIADAVMRALDGAALVVDVHASNIFLREIPQVRVNHEFADRLVPLALGMNVDVVWVHGSMTVLEATIAYSLNARDVPCLVVEMGVGMRVSPDLADQVTAGIVGLWRDLGVLAPDAPVPPRTHHPIRADDTNVHYLNAATSGLFVPERAHWTAVAREDLLGRIVSPFDGGVLSEVRSPVAGMLFTLREYPLVYEGSLMARLVATT
jgi:predicted deacylase